MLFLPKIRLRSLCFLTRNSRNTQTFTSGVRTREHLESTDFVAWRLMPCDRLREVRERQSLRRSLRQILWITVHAFRLLRLFSVNSADSVRGKQVCDSDMTGKKFSLITDTAPLRGWYSVVKENSFLSSRVTRPCHPR